MIKKMMIKKMMQTMKIESPFKPKIQKKTEFGFEKKVQSTLEKLEKAELFGKEDNSIEKKEFEGILGEDVWEEVCSQLVDIAREEFYSFRVNYAKLYMALFNCTEIAIRNNRELRDFLRSYEVGDFYSLLAKEAKHVFNNKKAFDYPSNAMEYFII